MIYRIGICDDEKLHLKINRLYIEDFFRKHEYKNKITCFDTYEKLINAVKKECFHILFLDIDLGNHKNQGIDLAKEIFQQYPDVLLVFITGLKEFTQDAFEVEAMGYILKPIEQDKMERILKRCVLQIQAKETEMERNFLVVVQDKVKKKILLDTIYAIQHYGRKTVIRTVDKDYEINETITSLANRLPDSFLRINQSDLVNKKIIEHMEKDNVLLKNGTSLKIGRTYKKSVSKLYYGENGL